VFIAWWRRIAGPVEPYLELLALVAGLFFLPKALLRFRIPAPLTEFALGIIVGPAVFGWIEPNAMLKGLSGFGISALFLFAGLEVELDELRSRGATLVVHLGLQVALVAIATAVGIALGLDTGVAVLVGAAIMSPSVGYIMSLLEARPQRPDLAAWIKHKAIAGELMAIGMVLVFANASAPRDLAIGLAAVSGLILAVPLLVVFFHRLILPWAPRTEFPFLLIVALLAAYTTHHVGVHYLAGAFLVGLVARRYLDWLDRKRYETGSVSEALTAFRFFSAFFVPCFFFRVGLILPKGALTPEAALLAAALLVVAVPLRVVPTLLHRRMRLGEAWREAANVGLFLVPTTVFTFAVADVLRERFDVAPWVYGGLVVYGAATSLVPLLSPGAPVETGEEIVDVTTNEIARLGRSRE
jgi:Kef-type K+ transport system membrane component KefB